ncbi:glycosyltransferase [Mycobacterium heidelbergense]|uniref:glycosyltransferase family 4 protein n=1 Tax=Mycobacterium heidelbergense TaxID=53376 RepID=UPI003CF80401
MDIQMDIQMPAGLRPLAYLAGSAWPADASESGMDRIAAAWYQTAAGFSALIPELKRVCAATQNVLGGHTAQAAHNQFGLLFAGEFAMDKLVAAQCGLGDLARQDATELQALKLNIILTLLVTAALIAWDEINAPATGGSSLADIPVAKQTAAEAIRELESQVADGLEAALAEALPKTTVSRLTARGEQAGAAAVLQLGNSAASALVTGLVQEGGVEGIQGVEGRGGFNLGRIFKTAELMAVGAGVGGPVGGLVGEVAGDLPHVVNRVVAGAAAAEASVAVPTVADGGPVDPAILGLGILGAAHSAVGGANHGGSQGHAESGGPPADTTPHRAAGFDTARGGESASGQASTARNGTASGMDSTTKGVVPAAQSATAPGTPAVPAGRDRVGGPPSNTSPNPGDRSTRLAEGSTAASANRTDAADREGRSATAPTPGPAAAGADGIRPDGAPVAERGPAADNLPRALAAEVHADHLPAGAQAAHSPITRLESSNREGILDPSITSPPAVDIQPVTDTANPTRADPTTDQHAALADSPTAGDSPTGPPATPAGGTSDTVGDGARNRRGEPGDFGGDGSHRGGAGGGGGDGGTRSGEDGGDDFARAQRTHCAEDPTVGQADASNADTVVRFSEVRLPGQPEFEAPCESANYEFEKELTDAARGAIEAAGGRALNSRVGLVGGEHPRVVIVDWEGSDHDAALTTTLDQFPELAAALTERGAHIQYLSGRVDPHAKIQLSEIDSPEVRSATIESGWWQGAEVMYWRDSEGYWCPVPRNVPLDRIPPAHTGSGLTASHPLRQQYHGEDDWNIPRFRRRHNLSAAELEATRVFVGPDGRLYRAADGTPFHVGDSAMAMFVMDRSANLYALDPFSTEIFERLHHSSFFAGAPVAAAGEIRALYGRLLVMADRNGHYWATANANDLGLQLLCNRDGLVLADGFLRFDHHTVVRESTLTDDLDLGRHLIDGTSLPGVKHPRGGVDESAAAREDHQPHDANTTTHRRNDPDRGLDNPAAKPGSDHPNNPESQRQNQAGEDHPAPDHTGSDVQKPRDEDRPVGDSQRVVDGGPSKDVGVIKAGHGDSDPGHGEPESRNGGGNGSDGPDMPGPGAAGGDDLAGGDAWPRRILVYCDRWGRNNGMETLNMDLCRGWADAGREVYVRVRREAEAAVPPGVTVIGPRNGKPAGLADLPESVDLVIGHGHDGGMAAVAAVEHRYPDAKSIHLLHLLPMAWYTLAKTPHIGRARLAADIYIARHVDLVSGVGEVLTAEALASSSMGGRASVLELPPMLTMAEQPPLPSPDAPERVLLFGRTDDPLKGAEEAARIVSQRRSRGHDTRLVTVGGDPQTLRQARGRLAALVGEPDAVEVLPRTSNPEELKAIIRSATLVIMPSRIESFGLVATEAIEHGVPVMMPSSSGAGRFLTGLSGYREAAERFNLVEQHFGAPPSVDAWIERLDAVLDDLPAAWANARQLQERLASFTPQHSAEHLVNAARNARSDPPLQGTPARARVKAIGWGVSVYPYGDEAGDHDLILAVADAMETDPKVKAAIAGIAPVNFV